MISDSQAQRPARWMDAAAWRVLVEGTAAFGALSYAVGWLFFALFYAEFDVSPETAGIDFQFIVVRAGLLLAVALFVLLVSALLFPRRVGVLVVTGHWRMRNRAFVAAFLLIQVLVVAALVLFANSWRPWSALNLPWNLLVAVVFVAGSLGAVWLEASLILILSNYKAKADEIVVARPVPLIVFAFLAVVALVGALVALAPRLADNIRDGGQVAYFGFRADRVRVAWAQDDLARQFHVERERCATILGSRDGVLVLYFTASEQTVVVSSDLVAVSRDLSGTCGARKTGS